MGQRLLGLYQSFEEEEHRLGHFKESIRALLARFEEKLLFYIGLSLSVHLLVFGLFLVWKKAPAAILESAAELNDMAIYRAISKIEKQDGRIAATQLSAEQAETLTEYLAPLFSFEKGLKESDKTEFFKALLELSSDSALKDTPKSGFDPLSLDRLIGLLKAGERRGLASGDSLVITKSPLSDRYQVDRLDKRSSEEIERLSREFMNEKIRTPSVNGMVKVETEEGPISIPEEYFFKNPPYEEILAKGSLLFTVFNGFPALGERQEPSSPGGRTYDPRLDKKSTLPDTGLVLIVGPYRWSEKSGKPLLRLSADERGRVLDDLMVMRESDQLDVFRSRYLDQYDPDGADLADLTREFLYSNMNNIFFVTDLFSSTFDFIEGLLFKRDVYDFNASFGSRMAKTRTGVELLFNLASGYDFERRTLMNLFASRGDVLEIMAGARDAGNVFQPGLKAFVLDRLYQEVSERAGEMHLPPAALSRTYIRHQEEIYEMLSGMDSETRNRALYAWGLLYWAQGKTDQALEKWKQVDISFPVPSRSYWKIMEFIEKDGLERSIDGVNGTLMKESLSDRQVLLQRHLKFHTWKKRAN